ncbi:MAG: DeoR/GlpR family DNA-binding transcription regulator [Anaerolineales bacterium]
MLSEERHRKILDVIAKEGRITVAQICEMFSVSEMTARRDLRILDRQGLLRKVHGGAVSSLGHSYETPYNLRITQAVEVKQAIGRIAAEMVIEGDSIALDIGTTALEIARALKGKRKLTIITAGLMIANEIAAQFSLGSDVRLILTGGILREREFSMIGHIAERAYRDFHVDKAFIGIGGLSLDEGLTEYNLEDALVKRPLLNSARQRIVVAEGSKLGRITFATIGPLSAVETLITDRSAPEEIVAGLENMGIQVVLADANSE